METGRFWVCPICNFVTNLTQDWIADHGEPVCPDCDYDMVLEKIPYEDNEVVT